MSAYMLEAECVSPPCAGGWPHEPANFYESRPGALQGACKPGRGAPEDGSLAELSTAPAMYDDESAIDFTSYIDSMASVPPLELCNDEFFADLFSSVKQEKGDFGPMHGAPGAPGGAHKAAAPRGAEDGFVRGSFNAPVKQEPEWGDGDTPASLPSQIEACAQTAVSLHTGQPTPPATPEPGGTQPHVHAQPRKPGRDRGKKAVDRYSLEYRQRRERNNIAVRKSRDKAKQRNQEMQQKMVELGAENERLHKAIEQLSRELGSLRSFFKQAPGSSFPDSAADVR